MGPKERVSTWNPPKTDPGSLLRFTMNYTGGNVNKNNTIFNTFSLYYPSGTFYAIPFNVKSVTATTITLELCYFFGSNIILYSVISITDGNGNTSNSLAASLDVSSLNIVVN